ncbi:hypothetical protein SAMN05444745_103151 [Arthrobacter sp. OV608]|jgi:hypothetical protein|nr:hypothetical protein SAMN05444745_103151 [Arthrobacter sp. OV608]
MNRCRLIDGAVVSEAGTVSQNRSAIDKFR